MWLLWAVGWAAWWRVREQFNRETNLILLLMPAIGMLSVPLSYVLLEHMKLVIIPQFQPGRYLLFVSLFAMILAVIAAYLRGAAKALSGGFCVLHRADRGVSGGMGYREAAGRPGDRCFRAWLSW